MIKRFIQHTHRSRMKLDPLYEHKKLRQLHWKFNVYVMYRIATCSLYTYREQLIMNYLFIF